MVAYAVNKDDEAANKNVFWVKLLVTSKAKKNILV